MLDNFREIYDRELNLYQDDHTLVRLILSSQTVRMFVYEVCKNCMISQPAIEADAQKPCRYCSLNAGDNFCANCGRDLRTA